MNRLLVFIISSIVKALAGAIGKFRKKNKFNKIIDGRVGRTNDILAAIEICEAKITEAKLACAPYDELDLELKELEKRLEDVGRESSINIL